MSFVLGGSARQMDLCSIHQNLKSLEALTGFSHLYCPDSFNNTSSSQVYVLGIATIVGKVSRTHVPRTGEETRSFPLSRYRSWVPSTTSSNIPSLMTGSYNFTWTLIICHELSARGFTTMKVAGLAAIRLHCGRYHSNNIGACKNKQIKTIIPK